MYLDTYEQNVQLWISPCGVESATMSPMWRQLIQILANVDTQSLGGWRFMWSSISTLKGDEVGYHCLAKDEKFASYGWTTLTAEGRRSKTVAYNTIQVDREWFTQNTKGMFNKVRTRAYPSIGHHFSTPTGHFSIFSTNFSTRPETSVFLEHAFSKYAGIGYTLLNTPL